MIAPVEWDFPPSVRARRRLRPERGPSPSLYLDIVIERQGAADWQTERTLYSCLVDGYSRFLFGLLRCVAGAVLGVSFVPVLLAA
jgi:hypothetical protein